MKVHLKFAEAFGARAVKSLPGAVGKPRPSREPKATARSSFPGLELRAGRPGRTAEAVSLTMQEAWAWGPAWGPSREGAGHPSPQESSCEGPGGVVLTPLTSLSWAHMVTSDMSPCSLPPADASPRSSQGPCRTVRSWLGRGEGGLQAWEPWSTDPRERTCGQR